MPTLPDLLQALRDAIILVPVLVLATRLVGLRSFSKMSGYDFAITVGFGSILAGTVLSPSTHWASGVVGIVALFIVQVAISYLRVHTNASALIDNDPLLVMENGVFLDHNMTKAKLTRADILGKLREANALSLSQVRAVVFEPTGDISVLHGETLDTDLLNGVGR